MQPRHSWPRRHIRTLVTAASIVMLLGVGSPVGAATSSQVALRIADYAVATATHDIPARVVTAADVSNASGINTVNTTNLFLLINLGDVFGYSRLVLFYQEKPFADVCLKGRYLCGPASSGDKAFFSIGSSSVATVVHYPRKGSGKT
jgi:hypothetical protein